ncbi:50S ribosomal protein L24, RplX [Mycolicibacterium fortuitum]|uniref:50S ribosomal protein L24, RplX n=1 Tax=Mycolicibacterium fortuitum TaxID=1766 RepID=A0A378WCL0_MYCFO|nr:50S ribosomal protein L24, RplX [Mycolicibacterium fortuitum]
MKVHKGDTVLGGLGKDKGAKGKVIEAYPTRDKVLVEGVQPDQEAHCPVAERAWRVVGWHRHPGSRHPRFQRDGGRFRRQADSCGLPRR